MIKILDNLNVKYNLSINNNRFKITFYKQDK